MLYDDYKLNLIRNYLDTLKWEDIEGVTLVHRGANKDEDVEVGRIHSGLEFISRKEVKRLLSSGKSPYEIQEESYQIMSREEKERKDFFKKHSPGMDEDTAYELRKAVDHRMEIELLEAIFNSDYNEDDICLLSDLALDYRCSREDLAKILDQKITGDDLFDVYKDWRQSL